MNFDENILVLNLKNGDENSFKFLYEKYYSTLISFSYKYLKSKEESEEIVQNIFSKIWERRSDLNESLNFKSYLFQIAVNDIYNRFKKKVHEKKYHDFQKESNNYPVSLSICENRFDFQDILDMVKKVIDKFPPQRKLIFTMKKLDELTNAEIANKLSISVRTVENQVLRGVKSVRSELKFCFE